LDRINGAAEEKSMTVRLPAHLAIRESSRRPQETPRADTLRDATMNGAR